MASNNNINNSVSDQQEPSIYLSDCFSGLQPKQPLTPISLSPSLSVDNCSSDSDSIMIGDTDVSSSVDKKKKTTTVTTTDHPRDMKTGCVRRGGEGPGQGQEEEEKEFILLSDEDGETLDIYSGSSYEEGEIIDVNNKKKNVRFYVGDNKDDVIKVYGSYSIDGECSGDGGNVADNEDDVNDKVFLQPEQPLIPGKKKNNNTETNVRNGGVVYSSASSSTDAAAGTSCACNGACTCAGAGAGDMRSAASVQDYDHDPCYRKPPTRGWRNPEPNKSRPIRFNSKRKYNVNMNENNNYRKSDQKPIARPVYMRQYGLFGDDK